MKGHIERRYKNSYTLVFDIGKDPATGKRRQQSVSVKGTKAEAQAKLRELLRQVDTGSFLKPRKTTLAEFLERWLTDYKSNLSQRAFERYEGIIKSRLIPDLGNIPLMQLRPEHIQKHYTEQLDHGLSAGTVRYHHVVLHVALKTAVKWGLLSRNPADAVSPPKSRRAEMQTWDEDEINRFLEVAKSTPYHVLFYTAVYTGMRRSELLGLRWQDVDFIFEQISVNRGLHQLRNGSYIYADPKSTKSRRTIKLTPSNNLLLQAQGFD